MLIPFKAIHSLLQKHYVPKSLNGIITDCYQSFDDSIATAEQIEDYEYLLEMVTNREENEKRYTFFWDYRHHLPTILKTDQPTTLFGLASLCHDHDKLSVAECKQVIDSVASNNNEDAELAKTTFDMYHNKISAAYKLEFLKIQRNIPCPCGSGKKYKKCHGKNHCRN